MRPATTRTVPLLLALLCGLAGARADDGWEGHVLLLNMENDAVAANDRHYTHGMSLSYLSKDDSMPGWIKSCSSHTPAIGLEVQAQKLGFSLGQEVYTPEDLRETGLVEDDRPYAGWLYGSVILQRRGRVSGSWLALESFRLDLGVVGPESLTEEVQKPFHDLDPAGWDNQLETEPGFALRYDRRHLFSLKSNTGWGMDFIPAFGTSLGNIATFLGAGTTLRLGYNIPNEFAVAHEEKPPRWGFYILGGMEGRWVLHNIFLDGNTFKSSHSVDKEALVGDFKAGFTLVLKRVELNFSYVMRTPEFEGQKENDRFGSATVTMKF